MDTVPEDDVRRRRPGDGSWPEIKCQQLCVCVHAETILEVVQNRGRITFDWLMIIINQYLGMLLFPGVPGRQVSVDNNPVLSRTVTINWIWCNPLDWQFKVQRAIHSRHSIYSIYNICRGRSDDKLAERRDVPESMDRIGRDGRRNSTWMQCASITFY